ncbi:hypothetical protein D3C87_1539220 [compost metagenome]
MTQQFGIDRQLQVAVCLQFFGVFLPACPLHVDDGLLSVGGREHQVGGANQCAPRELSGQAFFRDDRAHACLGHLMTQGHQRSAQSMAQCRQVGAASRHVQYRALLGDEGVEDACEPAFKRCIAQREGVGQLKITLG